MGLFSRKGRRTSIRQHPTNPDKWIVTNYAGKESVFDSKIEANRAAKASKEVVKARAKRK